MTQKTLYAEDEPYLAQIVSDNLKAKGYDVLMAKDGQAALEIFKAHKPDLCLLDIMMPHKDGYGLAEDIRKISEGIPIIFLSAKSLTDDLVKGFKAGGNDYMRKPFSIVELLVRIEALISRSNHKERESKQQDILKFGNCMLDTVNQQLATNSKTYDLSYKEVMLLQLLIENKNNILERQEALVKIWGDDSFYNSNSMNVFMVHLRKMLRDDESIQLMGIRGVGYKLIC
jgi:DNA-binding response OmpR family regulator